VPNASKPKRVLGCTYCKAKGHYATTCPARKTDRQRANGIDAGIAERALVPNKHPAHWERLAAHRADVAAELALALGCLSDRAPAVKHITTALELLEKCR
jgi:hypothetical protein